MVISRIIKFLAQVWKDVLTPVLHGHVLDGRCITEDYVAAIGGASNHNTAIRAPDSEEGPMDFYTMASCHPMYKNLKV
jgi:hypothetical protein